MTQEVGGGRFGVKKCGRWEIGGKKMWEVGDWCICNELGVIGSISHKILNIITRSCIIT